MSDGVIGVAVDSSSATDALERIRGLEDAGIDAAWLTSGGTRGDPLTLLAAVAARTERISLGTSIVQTWSRHPVAAAMQAYVIAGLAPGRFRLGVGPGHQSSMQKTYGASFEAPLGHLREYVRAVRTLLQEGAVDMDGRFYRAHAAVPNPVDVPVLAAGLRSRSFELCGAEADGAITWVCPRRYVRDIALPALRRGAASAGRETPEMIVHVPVCVHEDVEAVREGVREQLGHFASTEFYSKMFSAAGFPGSQETGWTNEMVEGVAVYGDEAKVANGLREVLAFGVSRLIVSLIRAPGAEERSEQRTLAVLAEMSKE